MPGGGDTRFARALEFTVRVDMFGARYEPFRWGTAVFHPDLPLRQDSNYLFVEDLPPSVTAEALAAEADALQGPAGLAHRLVMFRDRETGECMAPGMEALGWGTFRGVTMALEGAAPRPVADGRVRRVSLEEIAPVREAQILTYPWSTPEVARQLSRARLLGPVASRHYAVYEDGGPVAWLDLFVDGDVAQLEELATLEPFRRRGHGRALMECAMADAAAEGATLVFLHADLEDWPREFYGRLGFEEIGTYVKCRREGA